MKTAALVHRYASRDERTQALAIGASVLQARWPNVQATCHVGVGPNTLQAHAVFEWPGVVRVTLLYTGELVAQSLPGRPFDLDAAATR